MNEIGKAHAVRLSPRERQVCELLLQGADNEEIAKDLKMARRTVKSHFNRLYMRFGIQEGIKRVKLAVIIYRRELREQARRDWTVSEFALPNFPQTKEQLNG